MKRPLLLSLLLLTACGSLEVQVDVLDPKVIEDEVERIQFRRNVLGVVLGQSRAELRRYFAGLAQIHRQFYEDVRFQFLEAAKTLEVPQPPKSLKGKDLETWNQERVAPVESTRSTLTDWGEDIPGLFDADYPKYKETEQRVWDLYLRARDLAIRRAKASAVEAATLSEQITQIAREANTIKDDFAVWVEQSIENTQREKVETLRDVVPPGKIKPFEREVAKSAKTAEMNLDVVKTSLIGRGSLFQDPHAFVVASPENKDKWAPSYNQVFGKGQFGNLNVAIKMNSPADFTLKGLTFDPSQVASIAAKVSTQALLVATQIAGVPVDVSSKGNSDGTGGLAASSKTLASVQAQLAQAEAKRADFQEALIMIGLAITREENSSSGFMAKDKAVRKKSAEIIKGTYEAHKERLNFNLSKKSQKP